MTSCNGVNIGAVKADTLITNNIHSFSTQLDIAVPRLIVDSADNVVRLNYHDLSYDFSEVVSVLTTAPGYFDISPTNATNVALIQAIMKSQGAFVAASSALHVDTISQFYTAAGSNVRVFLRSQYQFPPNSTITIQVRTVSGAGIKIDNYDDNDQSLRWTPNGGYTANCLVNQPRWNVSGGNLTLSRNNVSYVFGIDDNGDLNLFKLSLDTYGNEAANWVTGFVSIAP